MASGSTCARCGHAFAEPDARCPRCRPPARRKTAKEAYFSAGGLGLIDLIPGIRNLPYLIRLLIAIVLVAAAVLVVVPLVVGNR